MRHRDLPPTPEGWEGEFEEHFSAAGIRDLLQTTVLRGNARTPAPETCAEVAFSLNKFRWLVKAERGAWENSKDRFLKLRQALLLLHEVLPPMRAEITRSERSAAADGYGLLQIQFADALQALDMLAHGVERVSDDRILIRPEAELRSKVERWEQYSQHVQKVFFERLGSDASKEASYRFVCEAMPGITGETVTLEQVKTHLKRSAGCQ